MDLAKEMRQLLTKYMYVQTSDAERLELPGAKWKPRPFCLLDKTEDQFYGLHRLVNQAAAQPSSGSYASSCSGSRHMLPEHYLPGSTVISEEESGGLQG